MPGVFEGWALPFLSATVEQAHRLSSTCCLSPTTVTATLAMMASTTATIQGTMIAKGASTSLTERTP